MSMAKNQSISGPWPPPLQFPQAWILIPNGQTVNTQNLAQQNSALRVDSTALSPKNVSPIGGNDYKHIDMAAIGFTSGVCRQATVATGF